MGTDCLQVVLGFGECSLSLAIGVSQMMFRSHCLGTASVRGMGSSLVGQGFVVCAGTMSEGTEVTTGNLKAAEVLGETCSSLFLCILIAATQVHHSSPSLKEERVRACPTAGPIAKPEHSLEHSISSADGFSPNCSDDSSCKTCKGVSYLG